MRALPLLALLAAFFLVQIAGDPDFFKNDFVGHRGSNGEDAIDITTVIGGFIVFFFYWFKFNEWAGEGEVPPGYRARPPRHFTTLTRFLGWKFLYGLVMAGSFLILIFFPEIIYQFLTPYTTAAGNISGKIAEAADIITKILSTDDRFSSGTPISPTQLVPYAVMLTTVIWAGMRPFSELEKRFRLCLQEHAAIPRQAKLLIESFIEEKDNFEPDNDIVKNIVTSLHENPLTMDDFTDGGESTWFLYARAVYLNHLLQKYNRAPIFSKLAGRYVNEFEELDAKVEKLNSLVLQRIVEIKNFIPADQLALTSESGAGNYTLKSAEEILEKNIEILDSSKKRNLEENKKTLLNEIRAISQEVVQLIVCGVLAVGRSSTQRRDLLEAFGIKQGQGTSQLDSVTITWIAAGVVFVTFLCSMIYYETVKHLSIDNPEILKILPQGMNDVLYWSIISCLMHTLGLSGAFFLQRNLETARRRLQIGKPIKPLFRTQMAEAIWAACIGFSINTYILGGFAALSGDFASLTQFWWWALVPSVTAFFTAIYTQKVDQDEYSDDQLKRSSQKEKKNIFNQSLKKLFWLQGIATGAVATMVFIINNEKYFTEQFEPKLLTDEYLAVIYFGIYVIVTTTFLGLVLAKSLHMWIVSEKYWGKHERRQGKRRKHILKQGKWQAGSAEQPIKAVALSSTGAEIKTKTPLDLSCKGILKLDDQKPRDARVVRIKKENPRHCYVKFLDVAA